jgi:sRNA-binding regulator protein Hfq
MPAGHQLPAQSPPEPALLESARKKFATLSHAEEKLFRATQGGIEASALADNESENNPANSANWNADRVVRGECIAWLCTDPQALALVTYRGLNLSGMRIDADLDLNDAEIKFSLTARKCAFSGNILLRDAELQALYLVGCLIKRLDGGRVRIRGAVLLRDGFKADGEINLRGATIGGTLECDGAQFSNANGTAFSADGAKIDGSVFLRKGFKAEGAVNLPRATIGGQLNCSGAQFWNANGTALFANGVKIGDDVFLRNGFNAKGTVNLLGATIGGQLDCSGAQFSNPTGQALVVERAKIDGSVFLPNAHAEGEIDLLGATIGGQLNCSGAQFSNPTGEALVVQGAKIDGNVFLPNAHAEGEIDLMGATIGGSLECDGAKLLNPNRTALLAERAKIIGAAHLRNGFKAEGEVNLVNATAVTLVICDVVEAEKMTLDLRLASLQTFWDDQNSWPKPEHLFLDGFRYERLYEKSPHEAHLRKEWLARQPRGKFLPQPYEQLAAVLRQMGYERDARLVMMQKNRERARFTRFPKQAWWWYNFFGRAIGYGYAPWRAFAMSIVMILLGWLLFYLGFSHDLISPTSADAYVKAPNGHVVLGKSGRPAISTDYPVFNGFVYSLESFIPLIKADQSTSWTPNANRSTEISAYHLRVPTGRLLRYYLYCHIAAGWLFTSLWVGAVTGLVKS